MGKLLLVAACWLTLTDAAQRLVGTTPTNEEQDHNGANAALAPARFIRVNIFSKDGTDPRVEQPRSGAGRGFAPIGIVMPNNPIKFEDGSVTKRARATGFLVSPCYIVTNDHAVYGDRIGADAPDGAEHDMTFYVGEDMDVGFKYKIRAIPVAHGNFGDTQTVDQDWALLKLDKCVGAAPDVGWLEVSERSWAQYKASILYLAGYPGDHAGKRLWIGGPCHVLSEVDRQVTHDCPSATGDSGAPIVNVDKEGHLTAVVMNEGSVGGVGNGKNVFPAWRVNISNYGVDLATLMGADDFGSIVRRDEGSATFVS